MIEDNYLKDIKRLFQFYKTLGEGAMNQLSDEEIFTNITDESNSVAIIVQHLWGNMRSRWTDFLSSDGEKDWRNRDTEFILKEENKTTILNKWDEGWDCLFSALDQLQPIHLSQIIYIRNQGHTVIEAINRQLGHYAYHVGQIVFIAKYFRNEDWESLSIPKNKSKSYNSKMFSSKKENKHFTEGQ